MIFLSYVYKQRIYGAVDKEMKMSIITEVNDRISDYIALENDTLLIPR